MPPDLVIVTFSITLLQFLELTHRYKIAPCFPSYNALSFRDRFDWNRRAINLLFQFLQFFFNLYILTIDKSVTSDYIYGYSPIAHVGFLIIISFYVYDTTGMVMHPSWPSLTPVWIFHHVVAALLLVYDVSYRKSSAFPAAAFLIAAAGHIPNELRWFIIVTNVSNLRIINAANVLSTVIISIACVLPPPYLLYKCAVQLNTSILQVVTHHMRFYCTFIFIIFYIPHIYISIVQFHRAYTNWNQQPITFRPKKVD